LNISEARCISLETYRKNGTPVRTPVWLVVEGGKVSIRTDPGSGKAKRIRRNPHVRFAPCDMRGNVKGDWAEGEASFVEGEEEEKVLNLIKKRYGLSGALIGLGQRLRSSKYIVIAITPSVA
jgi:PPOX class probable F420-dependent enzyme